MLVLPEVLDPGYRRENTMAIARLLVEIGLGIGIAEKALARIPVGHPVPREVSIELGVREAVALYPRTACYVVVPQAQFKTTFPRFREWEEGIGNLEMRLMAVAMAIFSESLMDAGSPFDVDGALTVNRVREAFVRRLACTPWADAGLRFSSMVADSSLVLVQPDGTRSPAHIQELCRSYTFVVALRPREP